MNNIFGLRKPDLVNAFLELFIRVIVGIKVESYYVKYFFVIAMNPLPHLTCTPTLFIQLTFPITDKRDHQLDHQLGN